jgi:hypothetical protein
LLSKVAAMTGMAPPPELARHRGAEQTHRLPERHGPAEQRAAIADEVVERTAVEADRRIGIKGCDPRQPEHQPARRIEQMARRGQPLRRLALEPQKLRQRVGDGRARHIGAIGETRRHHRQPGRRPAVEIHHGRPQRAPLPVERHPSGERTRRGHRIGAKAGAAGLGERRVEEIGPSRPGPAHSPRPPCGSIPAATTATRRPRRW